MTIFFMPLLVSIIFFFVQEVSGQIIIYPCGTNVGCPRVCVNDAFDWTCKENTCTCECAGNGDYLFVAVETCVITESEPDCFSSETTVHVKNKGNHIKMKDVEVGDQVMTGTGDYQTVYSIDHRNPTKLTEFVQISYSDEEAPIELTARHMIFLEGKENPIPAGDVRVGDKLRSLHDHGDVSSLSSHSLEVSKLSSIVRKGLYNPLTGDGTIVVNGGIVASTYSAVLSSHTEWVEIAGYKIMSQQSLLSMVLKPYKYVCSGTSLKLCKTSNERVAVEEVALQFYQRWLQKDSDSSGVQQDVVLFSFTCFILVVNIVMSPYMLIVSLATLMVSLWFSNKL